ncbi:MAG: hypothetical protein M1830_009240, partial [Pleopsidium flavum]
PLDEKFPNENNGFDGFEVDLNGIDREGAPEIENAPIMDLNNYPVLDFDASPLSLDTDLTRRLSGSTLSTSSTRISIEPITEPFEMSAFSELPTFVSDYSPGGSLFLSATSMSPTHSPSKLHQKRVRAGSYSKSTQSSRPSFRTAPYSFDGVRSKPWSSVSCAPSPARRDSTLTNNNSEGLGHRMPRITSCHSSPILPICNLTSEMSFNELDIQPRSVLRSISPFPYHSASISSQYEILSQPFQEPPSFSSLNIARTFHSTPDPHNLPHNHHSDPTDPPDLFAPLLDHQVSPPSEDLHPTDPDLLPHEQDLRFEGDLYTPRLVRGHGNKREGWCGICKPGRWLVLKNSAFWYDKSFTHGISAATGSAFEGPEKTRRVMNGDADVWEGLCTSCAEWVALVSSKRKGTTWFRHAYKVRSFSNRS